MEEEAFDGQTPGQHQHFTGRVTFSRKCRCEQGIITIRYALESSPLTSPLVKPHAEYPILAQIPGKIRIEVVPSDHTQPKLSLTLSVAAAEDLLGNTMPTTETYESFCRQVRELKRYPMPRAEIPFEGGKSASAQGQTKKPGSHSQDKHK